MIEHGRIAPLLKRLSPRQAIARAEKIQRRKEEREAARLLARARARRKKPQPEQ